MINGWITAFFPYKKDLQTGRAIHPSMVLFGNDQEDLDRMLYPGEVTGWEALQAPSQAACRKPRSAGTTSIDPSTWSSWAGSWVLLRTKRRSLCDPRSVGQ